MVAVYDLRTNKIVLAGKMRKKVRLEKELQVINEEIGNVKEIIAKQEKEAEAKG